MKRAGCLRLCGSINPEAGGLCMGKPWAALGKGDPASRLQKMGQRNKEGAGSALRFPSPSAAWVGCREKDHQRTVWVIRFCPCFMPHLPCSALGLLTLPAPSCEKGGAWGEGGRNLECRREEPAV